MEYAFETARVRLYLPSMGETWLFVNPDMSLKEFKDNVKAEDKNVLSFTFLDSNHTEITNEEGQCLYTALTNPNKQIYVKINDNMHMFETVKKEQAFKLEDLQWFQ